MKHYQPTTEALAKPVNVVWTNTQGQQESTRISRGDAPRLVEWLLSNGVEYRSIKNA